MLNNYKKKVSKDLNDTLTRMALYKLCSQLDADTTLTVIQDNVVIGNKKIDVFISSVEITCIDNENNNNAINQFCHVNSERITEYTIQDNTHSFQFIV